jgi:hypothetical protein
VQGSHLTPVSGSDVVQHLVVSIERSKTSTSGYGAPVDGRLCVMSSVVMSIQVLCTGESLATPITDVSVAGVVCAMNSTDSGVSVDGSSKCGGLRWSIWYVGLSSGIR